MRDFFQNPSRYLPTSGLALDVLKIVAAILMTVDHLTHIDVISEEWSIYLGRGVYPIFAYVMACHLIKGRIRIRKYATRLLLFGLLAQIPHWILFSVAKDPYGTEWSMSWNILFTLSAAMLLFYLLDFIGGWRAGILIALGIAASEYPLTIEYGMPGILLPGLLVYVLRGEKWSYVLLPVCIFFLNTPDETIFSPIWWHYSLVAAAFAVIVACGGLYYTKRLATPKIADKRILPRWFLYWYYPVHLVLIIFLGVWLEQMQLAG